MKFTDNIKIKVLISRLFNLMLIVIVITIFGYFLWLTTHIFVYDQFITPTESMMPTLLPGDRIIVDKTVFGARIYSDFNFEKNGTELKSWRTRGKRDILPNDILVFNYPNHDDKINFVINNVYAKRCIGVPGDSVSIANGHFRYNNYKGLIGLNGMQDSFEKMPDSVFPEFALHCLPYDGHLPWTIKNFGPLYLPRKGDHVKLTAKEGSLYRMLLEWETRKSITFDWETDRVFADGNTLDFHTFCHSYYFMCGDNVSNSNDSRYWGLVPEEYIVGVVSRISYSIDPKTGKYRKDRIFKKML